MQRSSRTRMDSRRWLQAAPNLARHVTAAEHNRGGDRGGEEDGTEEGRRMG